MKRTKNIKCDYNMVNYFTILLSYILLSYKICEERIYKPCIGHGQWLSGTLDRSMCKLNKKESCVGTMLKQLLII